MFLNVTIITVCDLFLISNAGISRSSSIICAYLIQKQRMTFENALALVRKNRPQAKPNDGFIIKLKLLEKECFTDG